MNLNFIDQEFNRLSTLEDEIDYEFEPKCKLNFKGIKRNIYYIDLKNDFVDEVNTYGFSPFILENYDRQRKNPNIMRYMNKKFNHGLTNYVKRQHQKPFTRKKTAEKQKKKEEVIVDHLYYKRKKVQKETKKEYFLQKALKNLANNKLNLSNDEDHFFDGGQEEENKVGVDKSEDIQKQIVEATKVKLIEQLKKKYYTSLKDQLPAISMSQFDKPDALKTNFEKNFGTSLTENNKKIVALNKNKEYILKNKNVLMKEITSKKESPQSASRKGSLKAVPKVKKKRIKSKFETVEVKKPSNKFLLFSRAKKYKSAINTIN